MKRFTFRLEPVLILREREAQKAKEEYGRALQTLAVAQQTLADRERLRDEVSAALATRRAHGFRALEQDVFWNSIQQHEAICKRLAELLAAAAEDADRKRAALLLAKRNCEALAHLKENRRLQHNAAALREEEQRIDDLVSARFAKTLMKGAL